MSDKRGWSGATWAAVAVIALLVVLLVIALFVPFIPCPCVGQPTGQVRWCDACDETGWTSVVKSWRARGKRDPVPTAVEPPKK